MAGKVQSPEKELRFTRSGQAALFWMLSAVGAAAAVTMLAARIAAEKVLVNIISSELGILCGPGPAGPASEAFVR